MTLEDRPELSVVLPVYNEGEAVAPVIRALVASIHVPCEVLLVYDFDGDTTVPVARALASELPQVRPLRNELGRGVLNAMKAGIAAARAPTCSSPWPTGPMSRRLSTEWWSWPEMVRTSWLRVAI